MSRTSEPLGSTSANRAPTAPDYLPGNRAAWTARAAEYAVAGESAWLAEPSWGIWGIPDGDLGLLPDSLSGRDCLELGCGAAYVSAWMARRGGRVVGVDPTRAQLDTARSLQARHGPRFALVEGVGEQLPFGPDSFDFAVSEYGACLWADPFRWIPEAARVLRPGGRLIFLTNSPWQVVTIAEDGTDQVSTRLLRPYLNMYRVRYADAPGETEFHLPHGAMFDLLRDAGFTVEGLRELGAPDDAHSRYPWADAAWARQWPTEEVWLARRR